MRSAARALLHGHWNSNVKELHEVKEELGTMRVRGKLEDFAASVFQDLHACCPSKAAYTGTAVGWCGKLKSDFEVGSATLDGALKHLHKQ